MIFRNAEQVFVVFSEDLCGKRGVKMWSGPVSLNDAAVTVRVFHDNFQRVASLGLRDTGQKTVSLASELSVR